jgi:hypothetical protein
MRAIRLRRRKTARSIAGATMSQNGNQPNSGLDPRNSGTQIKAARPATSQHVNARTHGCMSSDRTAAREVCDGANGMRMFGALSSGVARTIATRHLTD